MKLSPVRLSGALCALVGLVAPVVNAQTADAGLARLEAELVDSRQSRMARSASGSITWRRAGSCT